jgi:hypothetical protein
MEPSFCSDRSRGMQEDPIGTATPIETYVLLESSLPWAGDAWDTPSLPSELRAAIAHIKTHYPQTRCLLINQDQTRFRRQRSLIVYQRQARSLVSRFDRYEFVIDRPEDAIDILKSFFAKRFSTRFVVRPTQDVLICTHGSHDRCCARHGNPFYVQARRMVQSLSADVQVWRCSHFGGHRFAPTAITLPDGRVYARLDSFSLKSILSRSGSLDSMNAIYRGSSLLPSELQGLERSLLLRFGWNWMKTGFRATMHPIVGYPQALQAQIEFQLPGEALMSCQAQIIPDLDKSVTLRATCNVDMESTYLQYQIQQLNFSVLSTSSTFTTDLSSEIPVA